MANPYQSSNLGFTLTLVVLALIFTFISCYVYSCLSCFSRINPLAVIAIIYFHPFIFIYSIFKKNEVTIKGYFLKVFSIIGLSTALIFSITGYFLTRDEQKDYLELEKYLEISSLNNFDIIRFSTSKVYYNDKTYRMAKSYSTNATIVKADTEYYYVFDYTFKDDNTIAQIYRNSYDSNIAIYQEYEVTGLTCKLFDITVDDYGFAFAYNDENKYCNSVVFNFKTDSFTKYFLVSPSSALEIENTKVYETVNNEKSIYILDSNNETTDIIDLDRISEVAETKDFIAEYNTLKYSLTIEYVDSNLIYFGYEYGFLVDYSLVYCYNTETKEIVYGGYCDFNRFDNYNIYLN